MKRVIDVHMYLLDLWLLNSHSQNVVVHTHVRGTAEMHNWQFLLPTLFDSQCARHTDTGGHTQTVCLEHCSLHSIQD
jgi:hypothetical protein